MSLGCQGVYNNSQHCDTISGVLAPSARPQRWVASTPAQAASAFAALFKGSALVGSVLSEAALGSCHRLGSPACAASA